MQNKLKQGDLFKTQHVNDDEQSPTIDCRRNEAAKFYLK
jgi:hypothetical protein